MSTRNLAPRASGEGGIGTPSLPWASGEFINLNARFIRRNVYANEQASGNFSLPFSSGELQTIVVTGTNIHTGSINGGSAFGEKLEVRIYAASAAPVTFSGINIPSDSLISLPKTLTTGQSYLVGFKYIQTGWGLSSFVGGYTF
jgi:hypothetical protein